MPYKKQVKGISKKVLTIFIALTTMLLQAGILLVKPQTALAQDTTAPYIGYWGVMEVDGDDTATTTVAIFAFADDDTASPGGSPALTMTIFYQDDAWSDWSSRDCTNPFSGTRLFRCNLDVTPGDDARTVHYYLRAHDTNNYKFASWSSDETATTSAQTEPFQVTVYNSPSWTNTISGEFTTSTSTRWPGTKNSRCTFLTNAAPAATTTFYVDETTARNDGLAMSPNEWILVGGVDKLQVSATSSASDSRLQIVANGLSTQAYATTDCINEFVGGALVWVDGLGNLYATSSSDNATSSYGTFKIANVPDGTWDLAAFKNGYRDGRRSGISLQNTATTTVDIFLPYGDFSGGGDMEGARVIWSAPMEGTMGAPTDIRVSAMPMLIALSEDVNGSTITTSTVALGRVNPDGSTAGVGGYSVTYEPAGQGLTLGGTSYDFGPEAKIIVYASSTAGNLATSTSYVVKVKSSVTDTSGNSISGNDPQGGHSIFFSTMTGSFAGGIGAGDFGTGGAYMPPFVSGMVPRDGAANVALNARIALKFDQTIDSTTLANYIQIWTLANFAESSTVSFSAALAQTDKSLVILTPTANLAQSTRYRVKVLGGLKSSSGISMAAPGQEAQEMFRFEFETGTTADNASTTIAAISLDKYLSAGSRTGVPTSGLIKVAFSEPVNPDTISTNTIKLRQKGSTSDIIGTAIYDLSEGKAIFRPSSALNATTTYTFSLYSGINDFTKANNCLATSTYEFTTGTADDVGPYLEFMNADDYQMALTFNEPMNGAAVTETSQWPSGSSKWDTSVLNPKNYIVYVDNGPPPSAGYSKYFSYDSLASTTDLTFTYEPMFNTVKIKGLMLLGDPSGVSGGVRVWVRNVTDISGNTIQTNASPDAEADNFGNNSMGGPVARSQDTFGMVGPGAGMMGPPVAAGQFAVTDFGGKDPAMMGMMPVGVWPMNMVAGATSIYMVDIPISIGKAIPAGGKIILGPFPAEANVASAQNADINAQHVNYDLNGPGPGKVVIDTTTVETSGGLSNDGVGVSGQNVTVTLGSVGTGAPDFLHFELDGIRNPITPTQGGYKINIQTQDASGRQLESFTSMPFFLMPKGIYTLVGHATTTPNTGLNGVKIFGGSPSTGPLFTTTANNAFGSSTDGEFKIEGLNVGHLMLSPEPYISIGGTEYISPMPEPMFLDTTTCSNSISDAFYGITGCTSATACYCYKKFTLTAASTANTPDLTVQIVGNFSSGGMGTTEVDVFAGGPAGFRVKALTLHENYTAASPTSTTLYLPAAGDYHVGMGPAMPKGPMGMAGPPMPDDWMPPKDEWVSVASSTAGWVWTENSQTVNDGTIRFTITRADKSIAGHVYDPSGNAVSNAEVFAYSPTEHFGNHTHVKQDGSFSLNVREGFYKVGAFLPGAPPSNETGVTVDSSGNVYVEGTLTTDLIIRLSKNIRSGNTISGTVYSDTDSKYPASDASVYAYRTDGPGHAETMTDSKGTYTLYVSAGTWKVGVYLPDYGDLAEQTITVPPSKSGLNFAPSAAITYVTIRERVWEDKDNDGAYDSGEGVARATVSVVATTTDYINTAVTDANGLYEVKVPADTVYDIEAWSPDIGSLPPQNNKAVTSTDIIYTSFSGFADVPTEHATTVEITFYDVAGNATTVDKVLVQLDQSGAEGVNNDAFNENVATTTLKVSTSTNPYIFDIEIEGIPKSQLTIIPADDNTACGSTTVGTNLFATTTVDGYEKIKVFLPDLSNVSGTVQDESGQAIANAILHIEQPATDIEFDVESDSSGNYSFKVPATTTPYLVQVNKAGFMDSAVSLTASGAATTLNPTATSTSRTISGTITLNNATPGTSVYVYAEKLGGGYVSTGQANPSTGAYTLNVADGDWEVSAVVEGYSKSTQTTIATVSGSNVSGTNINVSASMLSSLNKQETLGMTGNVGGRLSNKDAGFEMNVPRSTLSASDSSSYNVKEKEISNIPAITPNANLVGDKAEEVSAYKMAGAGGNVSTVSGLNGSAFVDKIFTKAALATEGIDTVAEVEQAKMGTYDNAVQNWKNLPTTITYLDSSEQPVIPASDLGNVNKVVFNGVTDHFSTFGVTNTGFDGLAPAAPQNITITTGARDITISWSAVTTNDDGTTATDVTGYNVWRATSTGGPWTKVGSTAAGTTTYSESTDTGALALNTTYYYRVTADSGVQSGFSSVSSGGQVLAAAAATTGGVVSPAPTVEEEEEVVVVVGEQEEEEEVAVGEQEEEEEEEEEEEVAKPISEMTIEELKAEIARIAALIVQLQAQLAELLGLAEIEGVPAAFTFDQNLKYKDRADDVKYLQIVLNANADTRLASSGVGSPGKETTFFGPLTKAAVIKFQEKYAAEVLTPWGLSRGTGYVGKTTRQKLNELLK